MATVSPTKVGGRPAATSTPARPGTIDGHLGSPVSDTSDISVEMKENMISNGTGLEPHSPHNTSGYKSDSSQRTHDRLSSSDVFDDMLAPPGTSPARSPRSPRTPQSPDSVFSDSMYIGTSSYAANPDKLSPIQNIMQYRSPSPISTISKTSRNTRDSAGSYTSSRREVDYGKFYNQSYIEKSGEFKKGPSLNPPKEPAQRKNLLKPDNFSYSQVKRDFKKPTNKDGTSMLTALGDTEVAKKKLGAAYLDVVSKREAIRMSKYPDGQKVENAKAAIERDDWPAPPDPAAAFPELLRAHKPGKRKKKRRSGGGYRSGGDTTDGFTTEGGTTTDGGFTTEEEEMPPAEESSSEEEEEKRPLDPKTAREIAELSKIDAESGAAKALLMDLEKKRAESPSLDPRSSSRTPAADREPPYKTRYESSIFASPSRDTDQRSRLHSMDDLLMTRKYRTSTLASGFPEDEKLRRKSDMYMDRSTYDHPKSTVRNVRVPKPGYGRAPKAATMPGRDYMSDFEHIDDHRNDSQSDVDSNRRSQPRFFYSQSDVEDLYDPHTGLKRRSKLRGSQMSESLHSPSYYASRNAPTIFGAVPPKIYHYEQLKLTNPELPPDVDRNNLERNLDNEEFEQIFKMTRAEFYRLAEWKRNDLKTRVKLY